MDAFCSPKAKPGSTLQAANNTKPQDLTAPAAKAPAAEAPAAKAKPPVVWSPGRARGGPIGGGGIIRPGGAGKKQNKR